MRTAVADAEIAGEGTVKGDRRTMCGLPGNPDEADCHAPHSFDASSPVKGHIAVGHGAQMCLRRDTRRGGEPGRQA